MTGIKMEHLRKPKKYEKNDVLFWENEYISKQLLKAHLDNASDGASRKEAYIKDSVDWIIQLAPSEMFSKLLDLGCGPGLYTKRFQAAGYKVTGVDISHNSIEFAKQQDVYSIYECQDYCTLSIDEIFDVITFIYCDYGALSVEDRKRTLFNVYKHLSEKGMFILDVFTVCKFMKFEESCLWEAHEQDGFWAQGEHITFSGNYRYEDYTTLEQTVVLSNDVIHVYYIWYHYFTLSTLLKEMRAVGFQLVDVFNDVLGTAYDAKSDTLALVLQKS